MSDLTIHQNQTVSLKFLAPDAVDAHLAQHRDRVACLVCFGNARPPCLKAGMPVLWVDTPVLGGEAVYEVWASDKPVTPYDDDLIFGAGNEDIFFGCLSVPFDSSGNLSEAAQQVYSEIFDFLQRGSYPNLLKVWNYFPDITAAEAGIERYHSFCVGRHEAFVRHHRKVEDSPSACVLGSHAGSLVIYFLASRFPGVQIENPRQISAYKYPKQYGPRSPIFSRATLAFNGASQTLFISGTASIVGHVTVHPESVILQTRESLANIRAVIDQAGKKGFKFAGFGSGIALKVYVRHAEHLGIVRDIIGEELGVICDMTVLQADICRADLLMEIEAVCWSRTD